MRRSARLGLAALVAALLLAAAVSTVSARTFSVANQNIRVTWTSLEFVSAATIRCRVTIEGSFHSRTIAKVERSLIGAITRAITDTENCTGGRNRIRNELLPWHLTYEGFRGSLPNITGVFLLLSRLRYQIILPGICTADYGTASTNLTFEATVGASSEFGELLPVTGRNSLGLFAGSGLCPSSITKTGSGTIRLLGTTTRIRVSLI